MNSPEPSFGRRASRPPLPRRFLRVVLATAAVIAAVSLATLLARHRPASSSSAPPSGTAGSVKNVLIFLVDTLRPDHLGAYGYARPTSPNIDEFARQSVLFSRAFSVSPWTRTSVVSLFTSLYPVTHGCQDKEDIAPESLLTMAEVFKANGYRTRGFSSNVSVSAKFDLDQGFDEFTFFNRDEWFAEHPGRADPGYVPIEGMVPALLSWLDTAGERPFFVYFHSTDPHWRYAPPAGFQPWGDAGKVDRYDGEIRYTDHYFAQVIERLRSLGILDDTLVIFTADHGEELWDHGRQGHGHTLYNELLHVPLIMHHPSFAAGKRAATVRLVDLLPTLIELCDLKLDEARPQGRSLAPLLRADAAAPDGDDFVLAEVMYKTKVAAMSYEDDPWKVIYTFQDIYGKKNAWELYDVGSDPGEKTDLAHREPERLESMATRLVRLRRQYENGAVATEARELDEKTKEFLRSLGYLQ